MYKLIRLIDDKDVNEYDAGIEYKYEGISMEEQIFHFKQFLLACGYAPALIDEYLGEG